MSKYTKFSLTNPHYSSGESDRILLHNLFANMQMQQPLHSSRSTRVGSEGYYGGSSPFYSTGPVYRGMARNQQTGPVNQRMAPNASPSHQLQNQYRHPTSRLNRKRRRKEARKLDCVASYSIIFIFILLPLPMRTGRWTLVEAEQFYCG